MNASYSAALENAAWRPLSHFGRFRVAGRDAATLLHHLTTNDIKTLRAGHGSEAALISAKARLLDWLSIYRDGEGFLVVTSPNRREIFAPHARKFILYRQEVQIEDITEQSAMWGLLGPDALKVLFTLVGRELTLKNGHFASIEIDGVGCCFACTPRLPQGFWLWSNDREGMQRIVTKSGLPMIDDATYNILRVEAGVPVAGLELSEEINPWEACLDAAISLHKGCYNGQEVVARLNTYQKISKRLCGLSLASPIPNGARAELKDGERVAGWISSSVVSPRCGPIALGFVRGDWQAKGTVLKVLWDASGGTREETQATICTLPFGELLAASPLVEEKL